MTGMAKKRLARRKKTAAEIRLPGDPPTEALLARMIRVDHAGEFGARRIYAGQLAALKDSPSCPAIRRMAQQEDRHLAAFEKLIVEKGIRPTIFHPVWHVAGYVLGFATAALGEKAAMACTVAVEETIVEHYQAQIARLGTKDPALKKMIARFCAEEDEHRHTGREHGAEGLPYYPLLRAFIRGGSKTAIWLSERF
ncbi:MAG: demethoxyubiquinone hydroxylase family protein [Bdellovibrionales bacterium]